jgi:hypothetical protein
MCPFRMKRLERPKRSSNLATLSPAAVLWGLKRHFVGSKSTSTAPLEAAAAQAAPAKNAIVVLSMTGT